MERGAPGSSTVRDRILLLRGRAGLTQRDLAALVRVSRKAVQKWEAGESYPSPARLQALIALYLERGVFTAGREAEEAQALWETLRREAAHSTPPFDGAWFATLRPAAPLAPVGVGVPQIPASVRTDAPERTPWQAWGEAPAVAAFQGRASEQELLERWLVEERCRVVALLGLGGIGKTALATCAAHDLAPRFEGLCWRSLRNAPPPEDWLADAIAALAPVPPVLPSGLPARLAVLREVLRERRCLLVLDNLESVLEPGAPQARYRAGYEGYGAVLRQIGESAHQSTLLLTGREAPPELAVLAGAMPVRALHLGALDLAACRALLQDKGLDGDDAAWQGLVSRYGGNPLALSLVGQAIVELFGGDIAALLAYASETFGAVFGGMRRLLEEQFGRLSALEQSLLTWLAIEREPVGVAALRADLAPDAGPGAVLEALQALGRRSLLERGGERATHTLQPVVLEYASERLVAALAQEIVTGEPVLLVRHAVVQATSKDYVRRSQERLLAQPLVQQLVAACGDAEEIERRLMALLVGWRGRPPAQQGYGPGNVVNLLRLLRGELRGLDLSRLAIRQVYLQGVEAQDASLAGAHLADAVLGEPFTYPTAIALSADGAFLAAGTPTGEVRLWRAAERTPLLAAQGHTGAVWGVALSGDGRLVASGGDDGIVRLWEAPSGQPLATLPGHTGGVLDVALSGDGRLVASGGYDGTVRLWEAPSGWPLATLPGHSGAIWGVALSGDGRLLASGGLDGTVRLWEAPSGQPLATLQGHAGVVYGVALSGDGRLLASGGLDGMVRLWEAPSGQPLAALQGHAGLVRGVALSGDGRLLASGGVDGTVRLWEAPSGQPLATLPGHTGAVYGVGLSGDGRLLASASFDGTVRLWEAPSGQPLATLPGHAGAIWGVTLSGDGRLLVSGGDDGAVRLWEAGSGACLRTLRRDRRYERLDITSLTGVTDAQRAALLALGARDGQTVPASTSTPAQVSSPQATAAALVSAPPPQPQSLPLATDRPPTNVSAARTTFVGRATDLAALTQALDPAARSSTRLLTLTGVAGSGKTRLALAVAEAVRDAYQDGVWLVDLSPLPASAGADLTPLVAATLAALDLHEQAGQEVLDTLLAHLRPRRLLLVLDNCEHVAAACAALTVRLLNASPDLRILATSQQALEQAGETVWPVAPLALPPQPAEALSAQELQVLEQSEAVQLFVARAQAVQPGFVLSAQNAAAAVAICRALDGLPLTLELAAARLNVLPLEDILARLDDRFRLLRRGGRGATDRHQALQATLDWSYGLLQPVEQALLRRLAVFAGGWDVAAAEAVCAGEEVAADAVLELLDELLERSLVYVGETDGTPRYGLLETVRQYGLQQLERAGETAPLRDRHLAWCLALAEQAAPALLGAEQGVWLARLEREYDNLRASLRWSLCAGAGDRRALHLAVTLVRFWIVHSHLSEGRHWLAETLAAADGISAERARALDGAGLLAEAQGAYEDATRLLEESLALCRTMGDAAGTARALANLGLLAERQSAYARARALLEEALTLFRALEARDDVAGTLTALGLVIEFQGDYDTAWALLEEGLALFRNLGDAWGIANALGNMAITARRHGHYDQSLTLYEEALTLARTLGDRRGIARWLNGLGLSLGSRGEYERAQACLAESLALSRANGDRRGIAFSLNDLGEIARKQGAYRRAQEFFEESLTLLRQVGDTWLIANSYRNLAGVATEAGDDQRAARLLPQSLELFQSLGDRWGIAQCLELGSRLAAEHGRWAAAAELLAGADAMRGSIETQLDPDERAAHDHLLQTIETALGEERCAALWTSARARSLDDLLATLAVAIVADAAAEADHRTPSHAEL